MSLSFLPADIRAALSHINANYVSEIRIRKGQPVIIGYAGEYYYLDKFGLSRSADGAIFAGEVQPIINAATGGSIFSYAEQMKGGFITCGHGVRIGLAGEYVTQNGYVNAVGNLTSLNIRIPHDIEGCAQSICTKLLSSGLHSILLYSRPGLGKTTKLRDIVKFLSKKAYNVLVFDERGEISAMDASGNGFNLGERVDVVRAGDKLTGFESAIRAMKPDVIVTDELYGEDDLKAVKYAADCGICVVASSHVVNKSILKEMPFEYFVELKSVLGEPEIYDKNFVACGGCGSDDLDRGVSRGK